MKKRISLFLCVLALLLFAQSACALEIDHVIFGLQSVKAFDSAGTVNNIANVQSSKFTNPYEVQKSFDSYLKNNPSALITPSSGSVSVKAVGTDIGPALGSQLPPPTNFGKIDDYLVTIPMTELTSSGTIVRNVQVFHGRTSTDFDALAVDDDDAGSDDEEIMGWEKLDAGLMQQGEPKVEFIYGSSGSSGSYNTPSTDPVDFKITNEIPDSAPTKVGSNLNIYLRTDSFSPFVIVWEEVSLYDVPQTGDSASLAPWVLLLCGAFVLLALSRRRLHA